MHHFISFFSFFFKKILETQKVLSQDEIKHFEKARWFCSQSKRHLKFPDDGLASLMSTKHTHPSSLSSIRKKDTTLMFSFDSKSCLLVTAVQLMSNDMI